MESQAWGLKEQHAGWGFGNSPSSLPSLSLKAILTYHGATWASHRVPQCCTGDCQPEMWGAMAVQSPNNVHNMYPYTHFLWVPSDSRYSSMIPCYLYSSLLNWMNKKHQMLSKNSITVCPNAIKLPSSKVASQIKTPICPLSYCLKRGWWRVCRDSFFL